jgi:hypothetical protein
VSVNGARDQVTVIGKCDDEKLYRTWERDKKKIEVRECKDKKAGKDRYSLEHTFRFEVPEASTVIFDVLAWKEGDKKPKKKIEERPDDFKFAYSSNGVDFVEMCTVTRTQHDPLGYESFALPAGLSGTVWVRVTDANRGKDKHEDKLFIDHMRIATSCREGGRQLAARETKVGPGSSPDRDGSGGNREPETVANAPALQGEDSLGYGLEQNRPNPFGAQTSIEFQLPRTEEVSVRVFNALGQEIRTLAAGTHQAGRHQLSWDGRDNAGQTVSAGVYFYRIDAGSYVRMRKMSYLR